MIRSYETVYIVHPELSEEQINEVVEKYKKVVEEAGGEVENLNRWEKRPLAYEIKGQREGIYVLMNFKGEPKVQAELHRRLRLGDDVLRHIIVRTDE
jgi:small subunit ribosomal protein S6